MVRRTVLTSRQRSALFSLPQHEADLLRHYTLSDEDLAPAAGGLQVARHSTAAAPAE